MSFHLLKPFVFTTLTLWAIAASTSFARVNELTIWGLSHHLGGTYADAPRGLDRDGRTVFNPGIGAVTDSRESIHSAGFSWIGQAGYFQDCDARHVFYFGPGARYLYRINDLFSLGSSMSVGILNAEDWKTSQRRWLLIPFPLLEGKFHFDTRTVGFFSGFSPQNKRASATRGGHLIFSGLSISL
jgi:hypothetical protein